MNKELKPCPFCGGEGEVIEYAYNPYRNAPELLNHVYWVVCRKCGCKVNFGEPTDYFYRKSTFVEGIIKAWNTRRPIDKVVEQLRSPSCIGVEYTHGMSKDEIAESVLEQSVNRAIEIVKGGANNG